MKKILSVLAGLLALVSLRAQAPVSLDYFLPDTCNYNKAIPTPASVLGFEIGEYQTLPEQGVAYIKALAEASDRVLLRQYGWTHERRPLYLLIISTEQNIRDIDRIKAEHDKLSDPSADGKTDGPVFNWFGNTIHGNETSGFNASLLLAYHLAAARTPYTQKVLENNIVLIDPMINPDGIGRFAEWVNSHRGAVPNPDEQEMEHTETWPGGRSNHYWFDLNRDWINQTQPESRYRAVAMLDWKPNIYTCAHEQGSDANYHFSPGEPTRVHPLIPDECQAFIRRLASDYYAPAFDRQGLMYFSGEVYDDYYPGRGREYLDFFGGIALLWEEQSSRGFLRNTVNGLLSFPMSIHNQLTTELATLQGATDMREELLDYQKRYYRETSREGSGYYVFGSSEDLASTVRLAETVSRNGVKIYRLGRTVTADGRTFVPDSAFVVPVRQARHRMVEALFEIRESYADSLSYDITGWTMPMAFNLPYAKVSTASQGEEFHFSDPQPAGAYSRASFAYAFEWNGFYAPRALYRLLSQGVFAKVSQDGFTDGKKHFSRGSVIVPLGAAYQSLPQEEIHRLMQTIAREDMVDVYALDSGFTAGHNLGSANFLRARLPRVAVIGSYEAASVPVGDLWHLMDQHYLMPLSILPSEGIAGLDLDRYNVIFVTSGHASMSASALAKVRSWVERGGTLVTLEQGHQFLRRMGLDGLKTKSQKLNTDIPYSQVASAVRAQSIPGVILEAGIDPSHPLCWGYKESRLPVFKNNAIMFEPLENRLRTPLVHSDPVLLSGNLLPRLQGMLAGTPVAVVTALGSGRAISFSIDPSFRAVWYGSSKLTANAIFWPEMINATTLR
ncbi:MAG: zinc carboxypeptidase [Bacteroidales bacterium]|jgi:hypothetical protein|nr:zinc carboxypeptidase [Bacteroidales bacterium]